MVVPLFWIYVVVELAAVVGLASTIGIGWTLLILLATFVVGLSVAGSQIKRQARRLRDGMTTPQGAVSDGALVALGALLVVIPGLVTSVLGLLFLLPPTRAAARPVVTFLAVRGIGRRAPLITVAGMGAPAGSPGRGDYIDGEVIDVTDIEPPALPHKPD
ncbi:FxsA family protein [Mycobacterium sp.]|uniref:FxsA family protein n=1 Tax=Mycobacterium sp. TaxID=1785 RepID=UPI002BB210E3|nr:FxsA family protein [Mycobacterium sp.]HME47480.1 FxsA family protein [Mycobacterium sp.]